jgi:hypothetical protein
MASPNSGPWDVFVRGLVARENLLCWERLWDDFSQEETREKALQSIQVLGEEDEENAALHAKKGSGDGKDMSKVK